MQQLVNGLALGGLYVTFAIGMALIYSVLRVLHIAHGAMILVGAYCSLLLLPFFGYNLAITIIIGMLVAGFVGTLVGMGVYVPLLKSSSSTKYDTILLASVAILIASQEALMILFGVRHKQYPTPINSLTINIFGISLFVIQIACAAISFASMFVLWVFLTRTDEGRALRALDQDPQLASFSGVNPLKTYIITLFTGSMLGGLSGGLLSLYYNDVHPEIAFVPVNIALAVIIVGGLGSIPGTIIAGLILGILETTALAYIPLTFPRTLVSFVVLIVILLLRPRGIMGRR